jgi:N4-gp56 family major capsid protein
MESKDDPLGQRGYVGAQTYYACVRLNEFHMAVVECAASSL